MSEQNEYAWLDSAETEVSDIGERELQVFIPRGIRVPTEQRRQVITALRSLSWQKRVFLDFLAENHWHVRNAYKAMIAHRGEKFVNQSTVYRWTRTVKFYNVMKMLRSFNIDRQEAVDPDRILMDHRAIADYGLDIIETTNAKTGKKSKRMRNAATALAALDKLGKHKKLWGADEQVARVVLDIVDLTGPSKHEAEKPAIEGEVVDGNGE
jgi:hypothetical protein